MRKNDFKNLVQSIHEMGKIQRGEALPSRKFDQDGKLVLQSWEIKEDAHPKVTRTATNKHDEIRIQADPETIRKVGEIVDALSRPGVISWVPWSALDKTKPGLHLEVVEAGVGKGHPLDHCSWCGKKFNDPSEEAIATCTHTEYVTLCRNCYCKAGNRVR
jgi:hypothetical protein